MMFLKLFASEAACQGKLFSILPVDEIRQGGHLDVQNGLHYCLYDMSPSCLPHLSFRILYYVCRNKNTSNCCGATAQPHLPQPLAEYRLCAATALGGGTWVDRGAAARARVDRDSRRVQLLLVLV